MPTPGQKLVNLIDAYCAAREDYAACLEAVREYAKDETLDERQQAGEHLDLTRKNLADGIDEVVGAKGN